MTGTGRRLTFPREHISRQDALRIRVEMSLRVKRYLPVLKRLSKLGDKVKREYVRKCERQFIDCVSECAKNVIKGNVPLSGRKKSELRRKKKDLRELSLKKTSLREKRRILQKGGFLTALLPTILAVLGSLFAK